MRKFRTIAVVSALAAIALLVPAIAQAAAPDKTPAAATPLGTPGDGLIR